MTKLPEHFFIVSDGALFDTRKENVFNHPPLREKYRYHFSQIDTLAQVKACLRAGKFAWPGGYPLYFITQDGCALSFEAVESEFYQVCFDHLNDCSTGWRIVGCDINYEDNSLICEHTNKRIPSAYCEEE